MISPENINLDKTKLKSFIYFNFKFWYILFYTSLAMFFIITKIKMGTIQIYQGIEILRTRFFESCLK